MVISSITDNNGLANGKQAIRPDPANCRGAMKPDAADSEGVIRPKVEGLADAEGLVDVERLADVKKPVVICYNLSVFRQQ